VRAAGEAPPAPKPAVPIKKSVTPNAIVCLEDGKKFKMLLLVWALAATVAAAEEGEAKIDWWEEMNKARDELTADERRENNRKKAPLLCYAEKINVYRVDYEGDDIKEFFKEDELTKFLSMRLKNDLSMMRVEEFKNGEKYEDAVKGSSFVCRVFAVESSSFAIHTRCKFWGREFYDVRETDFANKIEAEILGIYPRNNVKKGVFDTLEELVRDIASEYLERKINWCK